MYFNPKKVRFITLYLEELFCKVERELRTAFVRQNRNKKGIKKIFCPLCSYSQILSSKHSFCLQSVGPIWFPLKFPFFLLLRLTLACSLEY